MGSSDVTQTTTPATAVDALDGRTPAAETIAFAVDGVSYAIHLSAAHAAAFREDLSTWVTHARRTPSPPGTRSPGPRTAADRQHTAAVRGWARDHGYAPADRGRLPTAVQHAYDAAHSGR